MVCNIYFANFRVRL